MREVVVVEMVVVVLQECKSMKFSDRVRVGGRMRLSPVDGHLDSNLDVVCARFR